MEFYDSCFKFNIAFLLHLILCGGSFFCAGGGLIRKDDILLLQLKNFLVILSEIAQNGCSPVSVCVWWWPGGCGCICLYFLSIWCLSY